MAQHFGLRARFISLIILLLAILFAVIAGILIRNNVQSLRADLTDRSKAFAALATKPIGDTYSIYKASGTVAIDQQVRRFIELDQNITNVMIVTADGTVVYKLYNVVNPVSAEDATSFEPVYGYDERGTINRVVYPLIEDTGRHTYNIAYDISNASIATAITSQIRSIILYSIVGLLISAAVIYAMVDRFFLKPIKRLRDQALVVAAGTYDQPLSEKRRDEIGDLAQSVNQMAESLKSDIQKLKEVDQIKSEFMMIASHNLRTPLTVINGYLEMAKSQALSEELRQMLSSIEANSQRLGIFAEDLLVISSIETGQQVYHKEPVDLTAMFNSIIPEIQVLANDRHINITATITSDNTTVYGSKPHLRSAIWNLLDNALKFNKESGHIGISVLRVDEAIQIAIKDTGIGIAETELSQIFTKFHRGSSSLTNVYEGTGIGLYVTKLIINDHGGSIAVESTVDQGSNFIVTLPISASPINAIASA